MAGEPEFVKFTATTECDWWGGKVAMVTTPKSVNHKLGRAILRGTPAKEATPG